MLQLIYKSVATVQFSNAGMSRLLMASRVSNDISGITGILVSRSNIFLQVLEGPEDAVEDTFIRIANDPRHKCLQVLVRRHVEERSFPNWRMGFVSSCGPWLGDTSELEDLFQSKGRFSKDAGSKAISLLQEFRYIPRRRKVDLGYAPLVAR